VSTSPDPLWTNRAANDRRLSPFGHPHALTRLLTDTYLYLKLCCFFVIAQTSEIVKSKDVKMLKDDQFFLLANRARRDEQRALRVQPFRVPGGSRRNPRDRGEREQLPARVDVFAEPRDRRAPRDVSTSSSIVSDGTNGLGGA
jgi:hypothetical protein